MTFFSHTTAAERYARSRPYFHPLVIEKIKQQLELYEPVADVLDVACGTGQSSQALRAFAHHIVGVDISRGMLAFARSNSDGEVTFANASAESLPLQDASFDLVTVALAFHWFNRAKFLHEAHRVLRRNRWLVIYNNGFAGRMRENAPFEQWNTERYLTRYPTPPRNSQPFTDEHASAHGFTFVGKEDYTNEVTFTIEALANYLMTQSNVIASIEQGEESAEDVYAWLVRELSPLFPNQSCTFDFGGYIWYLQKQ